MDINELMGQMLSKDSIKEISKKTGTTQTDVKNVLASALPSLLLGAEKQANDAGKLAGFAGALDDHSKDDVSDIVAFLKNVDMDDGGKIVGHLLGSGRAAATKKAAAASGLDSANVGNILSVAAPLLMTLLGQQTSQAQQQVQQQANILPLLQSQPQTNSQNPSLLSGLLGSLLKNVDVGSLILNLLGGK